MGLAGWGPLVQSTFQCGAFPSVTWGSGVSVFSWVSARAVWQVHTRLVRTWGSAGRTFRHILGHPCTSCQLCGGSPCRMVGAEGLFLGLTQKVTLWSPGCGVVNGWPPETHKASPAASPPPTEALHRVTLVLCCLHAYRQSVPRLLRWWHIHQGHLGTSGWPQALLTWFSCQAQLTSALWASVDLLPETWGGVSESSSFFPSPTQGPGPGRLPNVTVHLSGVPVRGH